jgi:hypothetical protein
LSFSSNCAAFSANSGQFGRRIDDHRLELLAQQSALLVLLVDHHQDRVLQRGFADGHGARKRMQNAHLDGVRNIARRWCV